MSIVLAAAVNDAFLVVILASAVLYGTPLVFAALGELLAERSGVLNLGVEGMMLVGAVMGFWAVQRLNVSSSLSLAGAVGIAALAGAAMALIHAFLVITLRANQIVSGLALDLRGSRRALRLSRQRPDARRFARALPLPELDVLGLADAPIVGPILFGQSVLVYASWLAVLLVGLYLAERGRASTSVRSASRRPPRMRWASTSRRTATAHTRRGALAGVAGACYSLQITPQWVTGITGGAGWIAIALVIFSFWRADLCLAGAYLFGAFSALPFAQARGYLQDVPSEVFQALPYLMTVVVLVIVSTGFAKQRLGAPAALGLPYVREER